MHILRYWLNIIMHIMLSSSFVRSFRRVSLLKPSLGSIQPLCSSSTEFSTKISESSTNTPDLTSSKMPITVLSGFLGAGKTTFLQKVLNSSGELKYGLVVNDVASINIDSKLVRKQTMFKNGVESIELQNGCVCCSLAEDLMASVSKLVSIAEVKGERYDHIIVECSGIAEPRKIRELFQEAEDYDSPILYKVRLDTLLTVVDADLFYNSFGSKDNLNSKADLAFKREDFLGRKTLDDGAGSRLITELLLEQVECADVVLINKCDLLKKPDDVKLVERVIFSMNPTAKVTTCVQGDIPDPTSVLGLMKGEGVASWGILDEHRKMLEAVQKTNLEVEHDHGHDHDCYDTACTDPSHSHEHSHDHSCEPGCNDPSHNHDHSHEHQAECEPGCNDPSHKHEHTHDHAVCDDPSHDHDHSHTHTETTAETRFGITSFIYKRRRPFHPVRLSKFLQSVGKLSVGSITDVLATAVAMNPPGETPTLQSDVTIAARKALLRSKGFIWMASSATTVYFLSHAGQYIDLGILGQWWANIEESQWPKEMIDEIKIDFEGEFGDRRQELVFIGQFGAQGRNSRKSLEDLLDACLVTDDELKTYSLIAKKGDPALRETFFKT